MSLNQIYTSHLLSTHWQFFLATIIGEQLNSHLSNHKGCGCSATSAVKALTYLLLTHVSNMYYQGHKECCWYYLHHQMSDGIACQSNVYACLLTVNQLDVCSTQFLPRCSKALAWKLFYSVIGCIKSQSRPDRKFAQSDNKAIKKMVNLDIWCWRKNGFFFYR